MGLILNTVGGIEIVNGKVVESDYVTIYEKLVAQGKIPGK